MGNEINTRELRAIVAPLWAELVQPGARCTKHWGITLIAYIERLADALDASRRELRELREYQFWYGGLSNDWNSLLEALRSFGIEVSQPAGSTAWHWRYGGFCGEAPTIAAAYQAALICAGCAPAEPGADWAEVRRAALAGAREERQDDSGHYAAERAGAQARWECPGCGRPTDVICNGETCPACLGGAS